MAEDWLADVKKYVANVDEAAVAGIVRHCGIALRNRDSSLVAFSDSTETDRVRESFLKKKLELTDPDETLDAAIAGVGERMKADRTKNRVTVYYLLAEQFGKLGLFGGSAATTSAAADAPATGIDPVAAGVAGLAALGGAAAAGTATAGTAAAGGVADAVAAHAPHAGADTHHGNHEPHGFADVPEEGGSILGRWWLWLALLIALVLLFLLLKSCHSEQVAVVDNGSSIASSYDASGDNAMDGNLTAAAPVIPTGAGIVSEMRGDHPALIVYFDTGKAAVSPDFATKAADLKAYVAAHPGTRLAVSGYNDPTGNAAINAELSKNRAKAVAAALKAEGIPEDAVLLEKPADTTIESTDNAAARRVEVTIK